MADDLCSLYLSQSPEAVLLLNYSGAITFQNPVARQLFGFEDSEIIGQQMSERLRCRAVNGNDISHALRDVFLAAPGARLQRDVELLVAQKNGEIFTVRLTAIPLVGSSGPVGSAICASAKDKIGRLEGAEAVSGNAFLQMATELGGIGLFDYNLATNVMVWNDTLREHFGVPAGAPVSVDNLFSTIHPLDRQRVSEIYETTFDPVKSGGRADLEFRTVDPNDGRERWLDARGRIFYRNGKAVRHIGAAIDITNRKHLEEQLREAAHHDPLTGLPNRTLLFEQAGRILHESRSDGTRCAVLFVDVDRFRLVNDLYGHDMGDEVLKDIASRLHKCMREGAIVCRLGGDEFVVVQPRAADVRATARLILDELRFPARARSSEVPVSASIGISVFPEHGNDLQTLIKCADLAMYASQQAGRNGYAIYTPKDGERADLQLQTEIQLRHAVEAGTMYVLYQPIVGMDDGQVIGAEALVRVTGFQGKSLSPDCFIPIAERTGQIKQIGLWVAREVCRQIRLWQKARSISFPIAINVSALQLSQRTFADELLQLLDEFGVSTEHIQVEVTESAIMNNLAESVQLLDQLRRAGVRVSLDDFGTGYSSLSQLSNLPLDKLKIDQSFVRRLQLDKASQTVTDTIIGLGRSMNLQVIGEGIETQQALDYLRDRGCNQGQGFLFSRPLPAKEFESWCAARAGLRINGHRPWAPTTGSGK